MSQKRDPDIKLIATNPVAYSNYFIESVIEAGIQLSGTEVKSLRAQSPNLRDGYVEISISRGRDKPEAWLSNAHIPLYSHGNIWNHETMRKRRLLLHAHQIVQLFEMITQKGMTIIPTKMYFRLGRVKVEIGIAKGKKQYDKRQSIKKREAERSIDRAIKES
jgi:SsrA-binding protein